MKLQIKNKFKYKNIILFIIVWIIAIIANNAFLQRQYSSDTMCLIDLGYFEYPKQFFLLDGRLISTLVCYLGGVLNLSIDTYLVISVFIGIMLLALSVVILFKLIIDYLEINNKWIKFLVLLSSYTIIFNHMSIEYLLFQESCVMCAGVLFSILATKTYLSTKKRKELKAFILLVIAASCYQALINIFPTLVITLIFLKQNIKNTNKEIFKHYMRDIVKLGMMFTVALFINAMVILICSIILKDSTNRLERMQYALYVAKQIPYATFMVFIKQTEKLPLYLPIFVTAITNIITIRYNNTNLFLKYIIVMITAYLFCMVPVLFYGYARSRMLMAIGATMGISLLFITKVLSDNIEKFSIKDIRTIIISICVIAYFIFNVANNYINSYEHLKAFALDEEMGAKINEIVKEYEEQSGIEVKKISYCHDSKPQTYHNGIKQLGPLTERKFAIPVIESINYYCNKDFEQIRFLMTIYEENFEGKDYTEFSEEQLLFIDDTMYFCVY